MLKRSAARPAASSATAKPQLTAQSPDYSLDIARHGDMHDSAQLLLAVCKGGQDVRKGDTSSSLTTGQVTTAQTITEAEQQPTDGSDKAIERPPLPSPVTDFTSEKSHHATAPSSSAPAGKVSPGNTIGGQSLDGLLVAPLKCTASIAVTASV